MTRQWRVLAVASAAVFVAALDTTIVNVAFPSIRTSFPGATPAALSWVLSAYSIAFAALLLTAGRLADVYGRRRMFFLGLLAFTVASAACGLAPSLGWLIAARVAQAVGAAALFPASLALVLPEFPPERRSVAVAVWGAVGAVAVAAGPSIGGAVIQGFGWRAAFLLNVPVGAAAWLYGRNLLVESRDLTARSRPDFVGVAMLVASMTAIALAIVEGPTWGWTDARVVGALVLGVAVLSLCLRRSSRHPSPVIDLSLFRVRSFLAANAATAVFAITFSAMLLAGAVFLQTVWQYPVRTAGLALTPAPLLAGTTGILVGRVADRYGHRTFVVAGTLVYALGQALLFLRVEAAPSYWATWFPATAVTGIGVGLALPTLASASARSLPPASFAVGSAVNVTARQIGVVLGIALFVAILGSPGPEHLLDGFRRVWLFTMATSLVAGLAAVTMGRLVSAAPAPAPLAPMVAAVTP